MRDIDIVVGQKYRVVDTSYDYLKKGAIVKILRESVKGLFIAQDLSKNKKFNGMIFIQPKEVKPLKGIDPEEIKEGLRVHHKRYGNGTVAIVSTKFFGIKWDKKLSAENIFSRGGRFRWDDQRLWSCEELIILNEKDSASDYLQKLLKECDEALLDALYDYSQRQCKEALEELKRLNALNEESLYWRREGNKIIFSFVKEGKTIETSASCSPNDTFDYITGSQIALARLAQKCSRPAKVYLPKDTKDFQIEFI